MMNADKYIIRFDDITSSMNWDNFLKIKEVLQAYDIKALLGVVPDNKDKTLMLSKNISESDFFKKILEYKNYGDTIAQHGTHHIMQACTGGIMSINKYGETCDQSYEYQKDLLEKGKAILESNDIWEPFYMAPAHSFDSNTLKALRDLGFEALTDGWGLYPYRLEGMILVPQLFSTPKPKLKGGVQTICLHTNNMSKGAISKIIGFIKANNNKFVDFKDIYADKVYIKNSLNSVVAYYTTKTLIPFIRNVVRKKS